MPTTYSKQDCINILSAANEDMDEKLTLRNYRGRTPSPETMSRHTDMSWNELKQEAGIDVHKKSSGVNDTVPDELTFTQSEWVDMRNSKRSRYRKVAKVSRMKKECGCDECGYNDCVRALDYHHTEDDKDRSIADMLTDCAKMSDIIEEIDKCVLLCSNCHREKKPTHVSI